MSRTVRFRVSGQARSGLLCRILGLFAQLDLPAPTMQVTITGNSMDVEVALAHFGEALVPVVARKIAGFVGVETVALEAEQLEMA
jgi:hypothetical protein